MAIFRGDTNQDIFNLIEELKERVRQQRAILIEIKDLYGLLKTEDRKVIISEIEDLSLDFMELNEKISYILQEMILPKRLAEKIPGTLKLLKTIEKKEKLKLDTLEEENIKEIKKEIESKREIVKREIKENTYAKVSSRIFSKFSQNLIGKGYFNLLKFDLERANMKMTLQGYVSIILFTTLSAFIGGIIIFLFFLFFSIEAVFPIIIPVEDLASRFLNLVWIPIAFPLAGFIISYYYPSLERKSSEINIDYELPFVTINMAAISSSLINPMKIFEIIVSSDEFPYVKKELTKILNEVNIYGYNLVNALINTSETTPSKKMSELLKGLATTIHSGGDLAKFFETRAETLLFGYKLKLEKETKSAETFMDLYISIVIAAPMIFLLLLMMLSISGLGASLAISTITLLVVSSVIIINIFFILFLHLKKTG